MIVVTWAGEHVVVMDSAGEVLTSNTVLAAELARDALAKPVKVWSEGDVVTELQPGEPGFVKAALLRLEDATVTGE